MKILMISMFAPHFYNWTEQLKDSGHEVYWVDVFDSNTKAPKLDFVHQSIGWRNRIDYPGRYWVKNNLPAFYKFISAITQRDLATFVERKIKEIEPDVVHSFVLQTAGYPLLATMAKFPKLKWVFSAWGNDLFYRQQNPKDLENIKRTLPHFDYMFADCERDFFIAQSHGFTGKFLGVFPTGGGYNLEKFDQWVKPIDKRKIILIKGYEGKLGRCNNILRSLLPIKERLLPFEIKVFGGNKKVRAMVQNSPLKEWPNISVMENLAHDKVLELMGDSYIYIGNSISDGMPNTLLEAIIMGTFPIQSNPGGATSELIEDKVNGMLISDPENILEIQEHILFVLENRDLVKQGIKYNLEALKPKLERSYIRERVLEKYNLVQENI